MAHGWDGHQKVRGVESLPSFWRGCLAAPNMVHWTVTFFNMCVCVFTRACSAWGLYETLPQRHSNSIVFIGVHGVCGTLTRVPGFVSRARASRDLGYHLNLNLQALLFDHLHTESLPVEVFWFMSEACQFISCWWKLLETRAVLLRVFCLWHAGGGFDQRPVGPPVLLLAAACSGNSDMFQIQLVANFGIVNSWDILAP